MQHFYVIVYMCIELKSYLLLNVVKEAHACRTERRTESTFFKCHELYMRKLKPPVRSEQTYLVSHSRVFKFNCPSVTHSNIFYNYE